MKNIQSGHRSEHPHTWLESASPLLREIINLQWENLDTEGMQGVMRLSLCTAWEFQKSLKIALATLPDDKRFAEMAAGETKNLKFNDYDGRGNHAEFIQHFADAHKLCNRNAVIERATERYTKAVDSLPAKTRIESLALRERVLPAIFSSMLAFSSQRVDWDDPLLAAYKHYLQMHIVLDAMPGGHGDLLSHIPLTEQVTDYLKLRLDLYTCIPELSKAPARE
jgi:hypothetical protein